MNREMYAYKCKKCGELHYPFRMVCKKCRSNDLFGFDLVPMPRKGKLLTYTRLFTLPGDFMVTHLSLGIVELENGLRVTAQLKLPKPKIGMAVRGEVEVVRSGEFNRNYGMVFYPA